MEIPLRPIAAIHSWIAMILFWPERMSTPERMRPVLRSAQTESTMIATDLETPKTPAVLRATAFATESAVLPAHPEMTRTATAFQETNAAAGIAPDPEQAWIPTVRQLAATRYANPAKIASPVRAIADPAQTPAETVIATPLRHAMNAICALPTVQAQTALKTENISLKNYAKAEFLKLFIISIQCQASYNKNVPI